MDDTDRDLMIRTVIGEAGNQAAIGQGGVAHVIRNRLATGKWGNNVADVVLAKNQFEPWQTRSKELMGISRNDPRYIAAGRIVDGVMSGQAPDPTGGATHFANVQTVKDRNGGTVGNHGWISNANLTTNIGDHSFFAPEGRVSPDPAAMAYADTKASPSMSDSPIQAILAALMQKSGGSNPSAQPAGQSGAQPSYWQSGFGGYNAQSPMRGILGRFLANGFMGNGWHAGPVQTPQGWLQGAGQTPAPAMTPQPAPASPGAPDDPLAPSSQTQPDPVPMPTPRPSDADLGLTSQAPAAAAASAPSPSIYDATKPTGYDDTLRSSDLANMNLGSMADGGSSNLASLLGLV